MSGRGSYGSGRRRPVLTYFMYAPLRFSETTWFGRFAPVFDSDSS